MTPKIFRPNRTWVHIRWPERPREPSTLQVLEDLSEFPGVAVYPLEVQIPRNLWRHPEVHKALNVLGLRLSKPENVSPVTKLWEPDRPPFAHQRVIAEQLVAEGASFCCDMMGLGKTGAAVQAAETIRRHVYDCTRPVVILGPLFVRDVWKRELLAMGAIESEAEFCAIESLSMDNACWNPDASYYFIHYNVAHAWSSRLDSHKPCVSIADEAHWVKNGRAKRSKAAANIVQVAPFKILLTGTPMPNKPAELWHLLSMLTGPRSWGSPVDFRIRYCGAQRSQWGWQDQEPTHVEELQFRLDAIYTRRHPEDVGIELPELSRVVESVHLSRADAKHHHDLVSSLNDYERAELVRALIEHRIQDDVLEKLTALRKITSLGKVSATADLVQNMVDQDESVVTFAWLKETVERLAGRVKGAPVYVLTGEQNQKTRDGLVETFQKTGGALIATYGVLKEGVTLHTARHAVLHDLMWVPSDMLQAEKRIHRIGQQRACTSTWMVGDKTLDTLFLNTIYTKLRRHEIVFDERQDAAQLLGQTNQSEQYVQKAVDEWMNRTW